MEISKNAFSTTIENVTKEDLDYLKDSLIILKRGVLVDTPEEVRAKFIDNFEHNLYMLDDGLASNKNPSYETETAYLEDCSLEMISAELMDGRLESRAW